MYNEQLKCPVCLKKLEMKLTSYGNIYYCNTCKGKMVNIAIMRKIDSKNKFINEMWKHANEFPSMNSECPVCNEFMKRVEMEISGRDIAIDMCKKCNIIWLDENEFENLTEFCEWREARQWKITKEQADELSESFKKYYKDRIDIDLVRGEEPHIYGYPRSGRMIGGWINFFMLGSPTDEMPSFRQRKHALTLMFIGLTLVFSFLAISISFFFMPINILSIYYLYCFGARIENYFGRFHLTTVFLSCFLITGVITINTYLLFDGLYIASISASAGVIAFYTAMFPQAKGRAFLFGLRAKMSIIPLALVWLIILSVYTSFFCLIGIFIGLLIGYIYKRNIINENYEGE